MFLEKIINRKAFTGLMLMSILSILVGSIVLLITYLILNAVITAIGTISNEALNASMFANIGVINSRHQLSSYPRRYHAHRCRCTRPDLHVLRSRRRDPEGSVNGK